MLAIPLWDRRCLCGWVSVYEAFVTLYDQDIRPGLPNKMKKSFSARRVPRKVGQDDDEEAASGGNVGGDTGSGKFGLNLTSSLLI